MDWVIHTLRELIPSKNSGTQVNGLWVRAMHEPFWPGLFSRLHSAWAVLRGPKIAVAVRWPRSGEFEQAMALADRD